MSAKQKTIKNEFTVEGIGLHTGNKTNVCFKPSEENTGIRFVRTDLPQRPVIKVGVDTVNKNGGLPRCTSIGQKEEAIHTVEHLMAVLAGLCVDNLTIEIDGSELPGLDGSGIDFLKSIKKAGLIEQNAPRKFFEIKEPIAIEQNGSSIFLLPGEDYRISYTLDYAHPLLRSQFVSMVLDPAVFEKEIAPCRTFCLQEEAEELQKSGLGKGANYENTLVVAGEGVVKNKLRFDDEFARHKVLDLIGDLYLLGMPIKGHVCAVKSGHRLNLALLKKIQQQKDRYESQGFVQEYDFSSTRELLIGDIMKILPHRYPFLLVDRVVDVEKGKRATGIKNVTLNDNFFQGHFPSKPIMPGVLMVEAMAQTAGIAVLTHERHHGKVAYFMGADKVKFRRVVVPGDQLIMEVEVLRDRPKTALIRAQAKVQDEIAAEAEMLFSFTDASELN